MQKFIVFRLGMEEFGIEIKLVVEILKSQSINSLPEMPEFVSGVITVRGEVFPLIDLRKRFNITPLPRNERIIIIRYESDKIGLIVDEIKEIAAFGDAELMKPPSIFKGLSMEYLKGLGKKKGRVVIILDLLKILTSKEKILLKETRGTIESLQQ